MNNWAGDFDAATEMLQTYTMHQKHREGDRNENRGR